MAADFFAFSVPQRNVPDGKEFLMALHHAAQALSPGTPAPDFLLPATESRPAVALSDFRGSPVVLAFFPPGWNPARAEQLALYQDVCSRVPGLDARLLSLTLDGDWCSATLDGERVDFPLLTALEARESVAEAYGVSGKQALFVVDADGKVRWSHVAPTGIAPRAEDIAAAMQTGATTSETMPAETPGGRKGVTRREFVVTTLAAAFALAALPRLANAQPATGVAQGGTAAADGLTKSVTLTINGTNHTLDIEPRVTLLDTLRERVGLTGTKKGCDHGQCGACTVLVEGRRVNACLTLAMSVEGDKITTVEGLASGDVLHPVQAAFIEHDGFQCGYCTPGQICSAVALLDEVAAGRPSSVTPRNSAVISLEALSEAEIRERMSGNLCRCGAYNGIVAAVKDAASQKRGAA